MVVDDQQLPRSDTGEPVGDRARADAVVRHEPHQGRAVQAGERGHGRHLEEAGLAEDRRGLEHLRGVEVAEIGDHSRVVDGLARVSHRLLLAVLAEGVDDCELHPCVRPLEGEPCSTEQLASQARRRPAQRQAGVDAMHVG